MKKKTILTALAAALITCVFFTVSSFGQELPKPGTVIDKNNYKKYAHLFPAEFLPAFEDGFGLMPPLKARVVEPKPTKFPRAFIALSEKSRGKYGLAPSGLITGGYNSEGMPFPDLTPSDKDFALKLMWNLTFGYVTDESMLIGQSNTKRRGEPATFEEIDVTEIRFTNRLFVNPKPIYSTPINLQKAMLMQFTKPASMRNSMTLSYRYLDLTRADEVYIYLPALRRVLRGDAGSRSTPIMGSMLAPDDISGFDGRVPEFNYKFLGKQKILACYCSGDPMCKQAPAEEKMDWPVDTYELRDVYVIDIFPKNPKYPQSKKRIYIDSETLYRHWAVMWDRAGKPWKIVGNVFGKQPLPSGEPWDYIRAGIGVDLQFGLMNNGVQFQDPAFLNTGKVRYEDIVASTLPRKAR